MSGDRLIIANVAVGYMPSGEQDLISEVMPANTLNQGEKGVKILAWGTTANNANSKTLRLKLDGVAILTKALTANVAGLWKVEAQIFKTGNATQSYVSELRQSGAVVSDIEIGTLTKNDQADITIHCTGVATAANDIVQDGLLVELT